MTEYPTNRDSFYAHKLVRLMIRMCAAQEIGSDSFLLVTVIAHTEDAKNYKSAVTFWNEQLGSVCGFSWGRLDRARKRAMASGWLHYEAGGKSKVGKYWVTTPDNLIGQYDGAVDEDNEIILSNLEKQVKRETDYPLQSGDASGLSSPLVERQPGDNRGASGETTGGQPGDKCGTFFPTPTPTPTPRKKAAMPLVLTDSLESIREDIVAYLDYRNEQHRFTFKKRGLTAFLNKLANLGPDRSSAALQHSMANGWKGIFEPVDNGSSGGTQQSIKTVKL